MSQDDINGIRDLLLAIRTSTEWDTVTRQRIMGRVQLSRLAGIEWDWALNANLPLRSRLQEFTTHDHDRSLGGELARRLGLALKDPIGVFDPVNFDGDVSQLTSDYMFRDKLVRILRNHGYTSLALSHAPATDGLNHYNIYSQARTPVGQLSSNFAESPDGTPFQTPHGPYRTLEGYYHVLRVLDYFVREESFRYPLSVYMDNPVMRDIAIMQDYSVKFKDMERMREVAGGEAIRAGRLLKKAVYGGTRYRPGAFSEHAEHCFMIALVNKLHKLTIDGACLGNVMAAIQHHKIPFVHYYVMQGSIQYPAHGEWLPNIYSKIVELIDPHSDTFSPENVIKQLE